MPVLKFIFKILINKYFLATVAFIVWIFFFDSNNLLVRNKLQTKLDSLNQAKQYFHQEISKDSALSTGLSKDSAQLEKFAREKYLMKKDDEDLYLVIDTTEDRRQ